MSSVILLGLVLLLGPLLVDSYGNNECIKKYDELFYYSPVRGFKFDDCRDAEIAIKWKSNQILRIEIKGSQQRYFKFKMIVNDVCELNFETSDDMKMLHVGGQTINKFNHYWSWYIWSTGQLSPKIGCYGEFLRNPIDDEWVWTKIRVIFDETSARASVVVYSPDARAGEGEEYFPSNSTLTTVLTSTTSELLTAGVETSTTTEQPVNSNHHLLHTCFFVVIIVLLAGILVVLYSRNPGFHMMKR
ncbi:hypothetical protein M3Y95_01242900 [Aphelenchoides besseyi]|nr:hypothetical protein M3Y95_01242900 [Aphelenchoides besseyi]